MKIPTLDSQTQQLQPLQVQRRGANVTESTLLGSSARNLDQAADALDGIGDSFRLAQQRQDFEQFMRAEAAYKNAENELVDYVQQQRGENAERTQLLTENWVTYNGQILEEIENGDDVFPASFFYRSVYEGLTDHQKEAMDKSRLGRGPALLSKVRSHVTHEKAALRSQVYKNSITEDIKAAANSYGTDAFEFYRKSLVALTLGMAQDNGWPKELTKSELEKNLNAITSGVLTSFIDQKDFEGGLAYLREVEARQKTSAIKDIQPASIREFRSILNERGVIAEVQEAAADIREKHPGDLQAQIAAAEKRFSGEKEEKLIQKIKVKDAEDRAIREQDRSVAAENVYNMVTVKGSPVKDISDIPIALWNKLNRVDKEYFSKLIENKGKAIEVKTDPAAYQDLKLLAADETRRQEYLTTNIRAKYEGLISNADMKTFIDDQVSKKFQKPDAPKSILTFSALDQKRRDLIPSGLRPEIEYEVAQRVLEIEKTRDPENKITSSEYNQVWSDVMIDNMDRISAARKQEAGEKERKALEKRGKLFSGILSVKDRIKNHAESNSLSEDQSRAVTAWVDREIRQTKGFKGRALNADEEDTLIALGGSTVFIKQDFLGADSLNPDDKKVYAELRPEERAQAYVMAGEVPVMLSDLDAMPPEQRLQVARQLAQNGQPPSLENQAAVYVSLYRQDLGDIQRFAEENFSRNTPTQEDKDIVIKQYLRASSESEREKIREISNKRLGKKEAEKLIEEAERVRRLVQD